MRIGTWNLAGRWDDRHRALLEDHGLRRPAPHRGVRAPGRAGLRLAPGTAVDGAEATMGRGRLPADCVSGTRPPWSRGHGGTGGSACLLVHPALALLWQARPVGGCHKRGETSTAVAAVEASEPSVWGGDWNHALSGKEWAGSIAGRKSLLAAIERLKLHVPTASSPHQIEELLSIDHIAVSKSWVVSATQRHRAFVGEPHLRPRRVCRGGKPPDLRTLDGRRVRDEMGRMVDR